MVEPVAGGGTSGYVDGNPSAAQFASPRYIALDSANRRLLVADHWNHRIRAIAFQK